MVIVKSSYDEMFNFFNKLQPQNIVYRPVNKIYFEGNYACSLLILSARNITRIFRIVLYDPNIANSANHTPVCPNVRLK